MIQKEVTVLFGSPDLGTSSELRAELRRQGMKVVAASSSRDLAALAERHPPDIAVLDESLEASEIQLVSGMLRHRHAGLRIILILGEGADPESAVYTSVDPWRCLVSPFSPADLKEAVASALQEAASASRPVILCVDDDAPFLKSLGRVLGRRGFRVVACRNADQVLEALPLTRPAMVFIDVLMPGISGLDLAADLRERLGDSIPLVLLSARGSDEQILQGYNSGATYYLTKPCEPQKIGDVADYYAGRIGAGQRELLRLKL